MTKPAKWLMLLTLLPSLLPSLAWAGPENVMGGGKDDEWLWWLILTPFAAGAALLVIAATVVIYHLLMGSYLSERFSKRRILLIAIAPTIYCALVLWGPTFIDIVEPPTVYLAMLITAGVLRWRYPKA